MNIGIQFSRYRLQRFARSLALGLVVALCGLALVMTPLGTTIERRLGLDWLFKMRGATPPPSEVLVVGINSGTGRALNLPALPHHWPRSIHARLIERLIEHNAKVIVFAIDFSRAKPGDEDTIFARAIAEAGRVVLFERLAPTGGGDGGWAWIEERQPPAQALAMAAKALGPFPVPKMDQSAFEFWAFKPSAGDIPTTAAVALQQKGLAAYDEWLSVLKEARAPGVEDLPAHAGELTDAGELEQLMKKLRRMFQRDAFLQQRVRQALDRLHGEGSDFRTRELLAALAAVYAGPDHYYFNFYGPPGTIRTTPYETLLTEERGESTSRSGDLTNHVVFVGCSDVHNPSCPDRFYTSFTGQDGVDLSGVEIMATAYANLLSQRTVRPSDTTMTAFSVLAFGLLAGIFAYFLPATAAVPSTLALTVLYAGIVQWCFNETGLWLPLATPALVQLPLALLVGLLGQYLLERHKEKQISRALCHYIPEGLVRDLAERQVDPTTVNRVVFGTCLATDMSGFSALAELKSPQELAQLMNEYFDALAKALKRHSVDVMEFRADMIMCAWIGPDRSPVICGKAVDAAIEVSETIARFAEEQGLPSIEPRVGLQDGPVYVGHTGGGGHLVYSIQGDAANTAARLENLNKHLGTHVLAAEPVVHDADGLLLRPLGSFRLSGKSEHTSAIEILGRKSSATTEQLDLCSQFAEGLAVFQRQEWLLAARRFEAITKRFVNDGPSRFYLSCSQRYDSEVPGYERPAVIQLLEK